MNIDPTPVIVAILSLLGVILSAAITARYTKDLFLHEIEKKMAVIDEKLVNLGNDVREHNHYAKMFAETMPVVQEQIKVINHRLEDIEHERSNH